jgi:hypothetical protein
MNNVEISVPIFVDNDLIADEDGRVSVVSLMYVGDDDDAVEASVEMESVVRDLIDFWKHDTTADPMEGASVLYTLASECHRFADLMWDAADCLDGRRYEMEVDGLPEL